MEKYGFLYKGYKKAHWYWEAVILFRKLGLAAMGVFMATSSPYMQGLSATFILGTSLVLHQTISPYEDQELDRLEGCGLVTSTLTLYLGLWRLEKVCRL